MIDSEIIRKGEEYSNLLCKRSHKMGGVLLIFLSFILIIGCSKTKIHQSAMLPGSRLIIYAGQYPSIQAAIDDLPAKGGIVVLSPGEFEITEPLNITKSDVYLKGSGTATHIMNKNTNRLPAIRISSDLHGDIPDVEALWRIQISDLRITGNQESGHGILARKINEIYLDGITISENGGDGIKLDHCIENPRITHSQITYNKETGLNLVFCHDIVVNGNQFEENNDAIHCIDSYNLTMTGNNLDDHLQHGVVIENTYGSVVSGNMIEECNGSAIILDRDCYGITLASNVIAHNDGGIILKDAHGVTISATAFTLNKTHSIFVGSESGRITVSGNNFSDSYIGEGKVKERTEGIVSSGVTLDGGKNVLFSGNVFSGIKPYKAFIIKKESNNIFFENNMLINVTSDHNKLQNSFSKNNFIINE